jgi:L-ascorbate metabolism protein UlaG (beta-lactamase superfamily)
MKITWFGHSTFRLDFADKVVLIDLSSPTILPSRGAGIRPWRASRTSSSRRP